MLFDNNDVNMGFSFFDLANLNNNDNMMNSSNNMMENKLNMYSSKDGFLRGNMWKDEYKPYKNLTYINISPKNERERSLWNVMQYSLAINDLNLYLDLHPEDDKMYEKFKMYTNECIELKDKYSKIYGPLTLEQTNSKNYKWEENPWPWDNTGGSKYV